MSVDANERAALTNFHRENHPNGMTVWVGGDGSVMPTECEGCRLLDALDAETARADAAEAEVDEKSEIGHAAAEAWQAKYDEARAEVERLRVGLLDSERALADENDRAVVAEAALDRVRNEWRPHLEAVPLGLPCQCVGCHVGRAIDGA